jgi:foldase protein PrsA
MDQTSEQQDITAEQLGKSGIRPNKSNWIIGALSLIIAGLVIALVLTNLNGSNQVVAKVNQDTITKDDLYQAMLSQGGDSLLDQLVTEKLITQELKKQNIQITDQDVQEELDNFKASIGSEADYQMYLMQYGISQEMVGQLMKTNASLKKLLASQIKVSDEDIKKYFEENQAQYDQPEQVRASHILVDTKEKAEEVLAKLNQGAKFEDLAKEYSTDVTKDNGGDLGYFGKGDMLPEFEKAAFEMKVGEVSSPVKSQFGYHIIKVTDHKAAKKATLAEYKDQIKSELVDQQVAQLANDYIKKLHDQADIKTYLKRGGDGAETKQATNVG